MKRCIMGYMKFPAFNTQSFKSVPFALSRNLQYSSQFGETLVTFLPPQTLVEKA